MPKTGSSPNIFPSLQGAEIIDGKGWQQEGKYLSNIIIKMPKDYNGSMVYNRHQTYTQSIDLFKNQSFDYIVALV